MHKVIEELNFMPSYTQAGSVGDEALGLMPALPDHTTPSVKCDFSAVQSKQRPQTHVCETFDIVKWGIHWKQPVLIITFAFWGLVSAVGHHLYYHLLNGSVVSSPETQQWALRFGTAFSVFTITMLRAAVVAAYNQYIWKVFRDKSFSVADLNKIFSLTSDFTGFFSLALFKHGRMVIVLASLCWLLPLAGLTPTATLSVVTSYPAETTDQFLPTLDFSFGIWQDMTQEGFDDLARMGSTVSEQIAMPQLTAPAPNSSYTVNFYGPTIQCKNANTSEQAVFDQFNMEVWNESLAFTSSTFQMFKDGAPGFNISQIPGGSLMFLLLSIFSLDGLQLGVQTANSSIVCSYVNASFAVGIDYVDGVQAVSQYNIEIMNLYDQSASNQDYDAYGSMFIIMYNILQGNISISGDGDVLVLSNAHELAPTDVLPLFNTGLITCEEIFWWMNPDDFNDTVFESDFAIELSTLAQGLPTEYSLCRNRTIALAIQDWANNFTISLLSNPNVTVNVSTPVSITTRQNVYQYDSRNLIISYAVGIAATIFAVVVGFIAIHSNGVCHSTSFSAIMTSTSGNHQIGELSKGQSLGAEPLSKTVAEKKLRLGVIKVAGDEAERDEWGDPINRVGFGLEGTVMKLMKGVKSL